MTYKCTDIENLNPSFVKLSQTNRFDLSQNFDCSDININLLSFWQILEGSSEEILRQTINPLNIFGECNV